jgi:hypothetical protein
VEEELDTCSKSAGCSALGPGEGRGGDYFIAKVITLWSIFI